MTDRFPFQKEPRNENGKHLFILSQIPYDREFPFDLTFQPVGGLGGKYALLQLLPSETSTLLTRSRKVRMLTKGKEGIEAMGHSSEASGLPTQLKRQGAFTQTGMFHVSFQQVRGLTVIWSRLQSRADACMYLSATWKSVQRQISTRERNYNL